MKVEIKIKDGERKEKGNTWIVNKLSKPDKKRVIEQIKEYLEDFIK